MFLTAKLRVLLISLLLSCAVVHGQNAHPRRVPADNRFAHAVDRTLKQGLRAKLPPHISTLLGLTNEQECPVRQGIQRTGTIVQGIDISAVNKRDVVLFIVDESANSQVLYLTSREGKLRRVVSVKAGEGAVSRITDQAREAFEKQKQFWATGLAAASLRK